jgi:phosphinothricin acetyltransferase
MSDTSIRLATIDDAESVLAIYGPVIRDSATSFEIELPTVDDISGRMHTNLQKYPWIVCSEGDAVCGYAYGSTHRARSAYGWTVETSVYLDSSVQGRGVGRALYESLLSLLTFQGYGLALGGITLPNPASVRLHEACGFTRVGVYHGIGYKFGQWHDVAWYERRLSGIDKAPNELLIMEEFVASRDFESLLELGLRYLK